MFGLQLGWLLVFLLLAANASTLELRKANPIDEPGGVSGVDSAPRFLRVYTAEGEVLQSLMGWPLAWCGSEELLVIVEGAGSRRTLTGVNPIGGETVRLAGIGDLRIRTSEREDAIELRDSEDRVVRVVTLPAPEGECTHFVDDVPQSGDFRYVNGAIYVGEILILPDRGLRYRLFGSPSGRLVAVVERQGLYVQMLYEISTDGTYRVDVIREVGQDEMPLDYQLESEESPDGMWTARIGANHVELLGRDDERRVLPYGGQSGPWWSPDSQKFAFAQDSWLMVADLEGDLQRLVYSPWAFVGWTDIGVRWLHSSLQ